MATSLVDYQSLNDGSFTLTTAGDHDDQFSLPSDVILTNDARKPILMYTVIPQSSVSYTVRVNGNVQEQESLGERVFRTAHEAVDGSKLHAGQNNLVSFHVSSGKARFTDVVLMYQRLVDA